MADAVRVIVHAEHPALPADEQPDRQADDQQADRGLGGLLHRRGQVGLEEHDRHAEQEQARGVPEAPRETEPGGRLRRALLGAGDQRRDGGEVVGVGRVPEAEQDSDEGDHEQRRPVGEARHPAVEPELL